jgi:hypothetical protein
MLLRIPSTQRPGSGRLSWSIVNFWQSAGEGASIVVTLTR